MAITIKVHGKVDTTDAARNKIALETLNELLDAIEHARRRNDVKNFEYYSGKYDGYRDALALLGYTIIYDATLNVVEVEKQ